MNCKIYTTRLFLPLLMFSISHTMLAEELVCTSIADLKQQLRSVTGTEATCHMEGYVILSGTDGHHVYAADSTGCIMLTLASDSLWQAGDVVTFTAQAPACYDEWDYLDQAVLTKVYDFNWREPIRTKVSLLDQAVFGQLILLGNVTVDDQGNYYTADGQPVPVDGAVEPATSAPAAPLDLIGIVTPVLPDEGGAAAPLLQLQCARPHTPPRTLQEGRYRVVGNSIMWKRDIEWTTVISRDPDDPYKYWFDYIVSHIAGDCNRIYAILRPDGSMLDLPTGQDFDNHSGTSPLSEDEYFGMYLDFDTSWVPEPKGTLLPIDIRDDGKLVITRDCGVINHLRWAAIQYPDIPSLEWGSRGIFYAGVTYTPPFPMITSFSVEAQGSDALISWKKPDDSAERGLIGYRIYCNGTVIAECDDNQTSWLHQNLRPATYLYSMSCIYEDEESDISRELTFVMSGETAGWKRHIVIEEGTGTWCGNCPRGIQAMRMLADRYADTFVGISVHQGNDPMLNAPYANWLLDEGYVTVYPSSTINRVVRDVDPYDEVLMGGLYEEALLQPARVTVSLSADYTDCYNALRVTATSRFALSSTDTDRYCVGFVMLENGVHQPDDARYSQINYYANSAYGEFYGWEQYTGPVPAAEMYYDEVARSDYWFRGIPHSLPEVIVSQQDYSFTDTLYIPEGVTLGDSLVLLALLIDSETGEILNAARLEQRQFGRCPDVPLFYEGFRYGIPSDFARYDVDGNQPFSSIGMQVGEAWGLKADDEGNRFAYSTSYYSPSGTSDDWLVTSPIAIPLDGNYAITWRARSSSASYRDSYEVRLSTTGNLVENFDYVVCRIDNEESDWTDRLAVVTLQAGDTIHLAFRNVTTNGEMLFLDDIMIEPTDLSSLPSIDSAGGLATDAVFDIFGRRIDDKAPFPASFRIISRDGIIRKVWIR